MSDLLGGVGDFLLGSEEEREAIGQSRSSRGTLGTIGNVLGSAPNVLGGATKAAVGFGGIGDAAQWVGNVTGTDPFTGRKLSLAERGLGIAAVFGFMSAGKALSHLQGQHVLHSGFNNIRSTDWELQRDLRGMERLRPFQLPENVEPGTDVVSNLRLRGDRLSPHPALRPDSELRHLNVDVEDAESMWGQFRWRDTSQFMRTSPDPETAWARIGSITARDTGDPFALNRSVAFAQAMGERYRTESFLHADLHGTASLQGLDADKAAAHIATYEFSRWNAAVQRGLLDGKQFKTATKLWNRMRDGEELSANEVTQLSDSMSMFANSVWWIDHPELTTSPMATLSKVNIDLGEPRYDIRYKQFESMPIDMITWKEMNRRVSMLFQPDPAAMVPTMTQNIVDFQKRFVTDDVVKHYRTWYPDARKRTEQAAAEVGVSDLDRFIVVTALTSPSQSWDQNIPKAQAFVRAYNDLKAGKLTNLNEMGEALRTGRYGDKGALLPQDALVGGVLAMEASNPWRYFEGGTTAARGSTLADLGRRYEAGEPADDLIELRTNDPDTSLKVPSFSYGIRNSDPDDLRQQAGYMARLMRDGFFAESTTDDAYKGLRAALPVVVDRQAFKVPLGFSLTPDTFLSGQKGVFDSIAQAYRNASLELGIQPSLGRHFLPEELQAMTWVQYRIMGQVAFDPADLPAGMSMPVRTPDWMPNWRKPPMSPHYVASFEEGFGPHLMWNDNVYNMLNGKVDVLPFTGVDALDWQLDKTRFRIPVDALGRRHEKLPLKEAMKLKGEGFREVHVHQAPDGSMKITADDRPKIREGALRARYPLIGRIQVADDLPPEQPWLQVEATPVRDARALYDKLNESSRSVESPMEASPTGARYYPDGAPDVWTQVGDHMMLNTTAHTDGDPQRGVNVHRQLLAELRAHGIEVDLQTPNPHHGLTSPPLDANGQPEWPPDEVMQAGVFTFGDADQMRQAWRYLMEVEDGTPRAKRIYDEIVLDASFYTDSARTAPEGMTPIIEHHFRDANGAETVNLNVAGDQYRSNTTVVYMPPEFAEFVTPTRTAALDAGSGFQFFDEWVTPAQPTDAPLRRAGEQGDPFSIFKVRNAKGNWVNASRIAFTLDEGLPRIAFGVDDVDGAAPGTSIIATKARRSTGKSKRNDEGNFEEETKIVTEIHLPEVDGEVDQYQATMAAEFLRRIGVGGGVRFVGRQAPEGFVSQEALRERHLQF